MYLYMTHWRPPAWDLEAGLVPRGEMSDGSDLEGHARRCRRGQGFQTWEKSKFLIYVKMIKLCDQLFLTKTARRAERACVRAVKILLRWSDTMDNDILPPHLITHTLVPLLGSSFLYCLVDGKTVGKRQVPNVNTIGTSALYALASSYSLVFEFIYEYSV